MAKVTVIEPVIQRLIVDSNTFQPQKLRVAAYARVSTEQDEQQNSYEAQVTYYTHFIESNRSINQHRAKRWEIWDTIHSA